VDRYDDPKRKNLLLKGKKPVKDKVDVVLKNKDTLADISKVQKVSKSSLVRGYLGFMWCNGNDGQQAHRTKLFSSAYVNGHGWTILPENFEKSLIVLACRWSFSDEKNWLSHRDRFLCPKRELTEVEKHDFVIYGLACEGNESCSYQFLNKPRMENQFFMLPHKTAESEMKQHKNGLNDDRYSSKISYIPKEDTIVCEYINNLKNNSDEASEVISSMKSLYTLFYKHFPNLDNETSLHATAGLIQVLNELKGFAKNNKIPELHKEEVSKALACFSEKREILRKIVFRSANELGMIG
jgi:hypothetical protein